MRHEGHSTVSHRRGNKVVYGWGDLEAMSANKAGDSPGLGFGYNGTFVTPVNENLKMSA